MTMTRKPGFQPDSIKAIVFDLDGTLVDSMGGFSAVAVNIIHKYFGIDEKEAAQMYRETSGLPFEFQLKVLFEGHPSIQKAAQEYEILKLKDYESKPFFYDVIRTLPLLVQSGYKLCVSSNNHEENVVKRIKEQSHNFDMILGYREGFFKGKDHFDLIHKEFNLSADELLFVGDSLNDARTAHKNHIPFVARLGTFSSDEFDSLDLPLIKTNNFFELIQLLQGMSINAIRKG